jgi:hypothetical protein
MKIRLQQALAHLNQLIELGAEFPDAVYSTSVAFELDREAVEMLEGCYDYEQMVRGGGE